MDGIAAEGERLDLLCADQPQGPPRYRDADAIAALKAFSDRYAQLLAKRQNAAGLLALGRDLYGWLDGESRQLNGLLQRAERPLRFEIAAPGLYASPPEWALLQAPWELLADDSG